MRYFKKLIMKHLSVILMMINLALFLYYDHSVIFIVESKLYMFVFMVTLSSYKAYCLLKIKKHMFYQLRDTENYYDHYVSVIKEICKDNFYFIAMSMIFSLKLIPHNLNVLFYYFFDILFILILFSYSVLITSKYMKKLIFVVMIITAFVHVMVGYSFSNIIFYSGHNGEIMRAVYASSFLEYYIMIILIVGVLHYLNYRKVKQINE